MKNATHLPADVMPAGRSSLAKYGGQETAPATPNAESATLRDGELLAAVTTPGSIRILKSRRKPALPLRKAYFSIAWGITASIVAAAVAFPGSPSAAAESGARFTGPLTAIPAEQQIELAMSAGPAQITQHATLYVLGPKGYVKARTGANGFTCLVERRHLDTLEPNCYDAEGSATTLQVRLYGEELRAAGVSEQDLEKRIDEGYKTGALKPPGKPGLVYMLSKHTMGFNSQLKKIVQIPPHVMFYAPYATNRDFGGFLGRHVPFVINEGQPDAYIIVVPDLMSAALQPETGAAETEGKSHAHGNGAPRE